MIKTDVRVPIGYSKEDIKAAVALHIPVKTDEIKELRIIKRTLDLGDKSDIAYKMTVALSLDSEREAGLLKMRKKVFLAEEYCFSVPKSALSSRPIVVGSGPCGLFAALVLAEGGARPTVIERGLSVDERRERVELFRKFSILDTECNVQFGEGGAGTYSDGKLKSGAPDKYKMKVLSEFVEAGADEEILYSSAAHLGTDRLSEMVKKIREKIISLGGEFVFSARLTDLKIKNSAIDGIVYEKDGELHEIRADKVILATGHSATDVFSMLQRHSVPMEAKGFGIGVRIEHPREHINRLVYGGAAPKDIETASYRLVTHLKNGRSVYSFCMCPGGTVVAAASEEGGIVTNGMSEYLRDGENSNAAFLVSVTPTDFASDSALAGLELQRKIEKAAYSLTSAYKAPAVTMRDFADKNKATGFGSVNPSYPIGVEPISPEEYLPPFVTESLRESIKDFEAWMPGFYMDDAVLTGPETRTTSPVRVLRDEKYEALTIKGLYPLGEGAGYTGGIVSSAVDGIKCAEVLLQS
ncbi:MAG: hypothetical protein E7612_07090 [Ruminococcaceae bacterium]|nr:hypothetical protein [Oscillospiraceae bacterium]